MIPSCSRNRKMLASTRVQLPAGAGSEGKLPRGALAFWLPPSSPTAYLIQADSLAQLVPDRSTSNAGSVAAASPAYPPISRSALPGPAVWSLPQRTINGRACDESDIDRGVDGEAIWELMRARHLRR